MVECPDLSVVGRHSLDQNGQMRGGGQTIKLIKISYANYFDIYSSNFFFVTFDL